MNDLVLFHNGEPMTTTLALAEGTENPHSTVIKLVRKYVDDLQEFGSFGFEIQKQGNSGSEIQNSRSKAGRPTEFAYLNEPQSTLLLTYMRNNDVVRAFKKQLVHAFYDMARELRDETPAELPENGRAQRLVDAGRVFGAVSRILQTAERLTPERLETALAVTGAVADVDLKGLLESGGWQVPVLEALPPDREVAAMAEFLAAWHGALGSRAIGAGELYEEIRAMQSDEGEEWRPVHRALAEAAALALGPPETWGVRELGYRLRAWSGRIVNGLRLVHDGKGKEGVRWRVRAVKTAVGPRASTEERVH